jgi:tetratricopeptide (TPR) repeat protein
MARSARARDPISNGAFRYSGSALEETWERLHRGDREPFPDARRVARLAKGESGLAARLDAEGSAAAVAERIQEAWREFHAGNFAHAIELGGRLGPLGGAAANKAAAIQASAMAPGATAALKILEAARKRGEEALEQLPDAANSHYMLALVLGRYSQRISVVKALAEGLGGRVRELLERTLELEPRHAEAHIALGLYHAEIVGKLGSLVAAMTYGASRTAALEHFKRAIELTPGAAIAHIEYAQGLRLLDARAHRAKATELYQRAAECEPLDAMEWLDVERARRAVARPASNPS